MNKISKQASEIIKVTKNTHPQLKEELKLEICTDNPIIEQECMKYLNLSAEQQKQVMETQVKLKSTTKDLLLNMDKIFPFSSYSNHALRQFQIVGEYLGKVNIVKNPHSSYSQSLNTYLPYPIRSVKLDKLKIYNSHDLDISEIRKKYHDHNDSDDGNNDVENMDENEETKEGQIKKSLPDILIIPDPHKSTTSSSLIISSYVSSSINSIKYTDSNYDDNNERTEEEEKEEEVDTDDKSMKKMTVNHVLPYNVFSTAPNCIWIECWYNHYPRLLLCTLENIPENTLLLVDYGTDFFVNILIHNTTNK